MPGEASSTSSSNGELSALGSTLPRVWTRPLVTGPPGPCGCGCPLTEDTSYGFDVAWFAEHVLGTPLDPWERWLAIHAGELLPNGLPRFRHLLIIVARQNGKTWLLVVLCLYWQFSEKVELILSTSTVLDYAKEAWEKGVDLAKDTPDLAEKLPPGRNRGVRTANGQQTLTVIHPAKPATETTPARRRIKSRWKIAASNRRAGRSLSIDRLVLDELREHDNWDCWTAAVNATNARPGSQIWSITNMGDDRAVVLDSRHKAALSGADLAHGLFEWSMPAEWKDRVHTATDQQLLAALALPNPNLGRRIHPTVLLGEARTAIASGGEELDKFLTEVGCVRIRVTDPALAVAKWADLVQPIDLAEHRRRVALCFDVSLDGLHATLVAAAVLPNGYTVQQPDGTTLQLPDGCVAVDVVAAWSGPDATRQLRNELPGHVREVRPKMLGWFPNGPAAQVAASMAPKRGAWPPPRVTVEEIRGELPAVCMGLAEQIRTGQIAQPNDPLLNAQVAGAEKLARGDAFVFTRSGTGHVDAVYATAGAVHLARIMPPPPPKLTVA